MAEIKVTLPDDSIRSLPEGSTGIDLAADVGRSLAKAAVALNVNGETKDLSEPLSEGDSVSIITQDTEDGLHVLRHSTAHVLAQAVLSIWEGATYAIGPPIKDGFYYDFELPDGATFTEDDLINIEKRMNEIIKQDQHFERYEISSEEALELFEDHRFKKEIIERVSTGEIDSEISNEVAAEGTISYYKNGQDFVDLCTGPHVPSTGKLGHFALQKVAGAYWRGDEKQPMLQRIYGTAWASKKDLEDYLERLVEAEKRDHRRLAAELDLVSWPEDLGPGLAVWHPKGSLIRKVIEDYSRNRHENGGYNFVFSPHIAKSVLWETS